MLVGLLALSQLPDPSLSDLQAVLGELTPTNQLMLMTGAVRLVRMLIADTAEARGRSVEEVVAAYRRAFLVVRDEHEGGS